MVQSAMLRLPEAVSGLENQMQFAMVIDVRGLGRILRFHQAVFGAVDDKHVALIARDLVVDVVAFVESFIVGTPDFHAHKTDGIRHVGARGIQREGVVRDAEGRIDEQDRIDLVGHIRRRDGGHAAALALAEQEDVVWIHAVPFPHHFQHVHEVLAFSEDAHVFRAAFALAAGRAAGKIVAVAYVS